MDLTWLWPWPLAAGLQGWDRTGLGGGGITGFVFFLISALVHARVSLFLQIRSLPSILPSVQTARQSESSPSHPSCTCPGERHYELGAGVLGSSCRGISDILRDIWQSLYSLWASVSPPQIIKIIPEQMTLPACSFLNSLGYSADGKTEAQRREVTRLKPHSKALVEAGFESRRL